MVLWETNELSMISKYANVYKSIMKDGLSMFHQVCNKFAYIALKLLSWFYFGLRLA